MIVINVHDQSERSLDLIDFGFRNAPDFPQESLVADGPELKAIYRRTLFKPVDGSGFQGDKEGVDQRPVECAIML